MKTAQIPTLTEEQFVELHISNSIEASKDDQFFIYHRDYALELLEQITNPLLRSKFCKEVVVKGI